MAHGHADYGVGAPLATVHSLSDMAELAARLGSPVTFDRRGKVLWLDDFEGGVEKWTAGSNPAGGSLEWSSESSKTGRFCAKLTLPAMIGGQAYMTCHLAYSPTATLGMEASFALPSEDVSSLQLTMLVTGPTLTRWAALRYSVPVRKLYYADQGGAYQELEPAVRLGTGANFFHTMKLVMDLDEQQYVRCVLDNHEWSMAGKGLPTQLYEGWDEFRGTVRIVAGTVTQPYILVDGAIATTNES